MSRFKQSRSNPNKEEPRMDAKERDFKGSAGPLNHKFLPHDFPGSFAYLRR
jgi:hypothetical protein